MALEAVVRQDSTPEDGSGVVLAGRTWDYAQVRVTAEEDTIHVPDFSFVPVGTVEQATDGWDSRDLVRVRLDTDSRLMGNREHVVDNLHTQSATFPSSSLLSDPPRIGSVGLGSQRR